MMPLRSFCGGGCKQTITFLFSPNLCRSKNYNTIELSPTFAKYPVASDENSFAVCAISESFTYREKILFRPYFQRSKINFRKSKNSRVSNLRHVNPMQQRRRPIDEDCSEGRNRQEHLDYLNKEPISRDKRSTLANQRSRSCGTDQSFHKIF